MMKKIAILASYNASGLDTLYEAMKKGILNLDFTLLISNNTNSPALKKAKKYHIDSYLINSKTVLNPDEKIYTLLKEYNCEYVFLAGYMKKISSKITKNFKVINSHPSLLPLYGGSGMYGILVHEAVVNNNEKISGVTLHEVNENYDDGKIILQKKLSLSEKETAKSLEIKIKKLEKATIVEGFLQCLN